jgi:Mechanosensitive ion channel, conserved TM helix
MLEQIDQALRQAATRTLESIANFLPGLVVLLAVLIVSVLLAVFLRKALRRVLRGIDLDRRAEQLGISILAAWSPSRSAADVIAGAAYWTMLILGLLIGLTALDAVAPTRFAIRIFEYLPHLLAALLIMMVGGVLGRFLARAILIGAVNMQMQSARLLSVTVKWLVLITAAAMALDHVGIGRSILQLAFGIIFGGIVLAIALAVGLGARDVVSRALERQLREPDPEEDKLHHV